MTQFEQTMNDLRKLLKVRNDLTEPTISTQSGAGAAGLQQAPVNLGKPLPGALPDDLPTEAELRALMGIGDNPNIQVRVFRGTLADAMKQLGNSDDAPNVFDGVPHGQADNGDAPSAETRGAAQGYAYGGPEAEPANAQIRQATNKALLDVLWDVFKEVKWAREKHPENFHTAHEGHSVIREEFEELWDEIKADNGYTGAARKEAIQLAAMAVRYILDLDPRDA